MKKYFITGTNTDVGKTVVSALLCEHLRADYFKPIQTGSDGMLDGGEIARLTDTVIHRNAYCLKVPASPAFAAKCEGMEIDFEKIVLPNTDGRNLIVEGAGGCMAPINSRKITLDLIKYLDLPVILVVKNELGCVSSTLTSILALRNWNIEIAGVILKGNDDPLDNYGAIEYYGKVDVLDKIGFIPELNKDSIKNYRLSDKLLKKLMD